MFETREVPTLAPVSAEDKQVIDEIDLTVATKRTGVTTPTKEQIDEVIDWIKYYFAQHNTFTSKSEEEARKCVAPTAKDLTRRALALGDLECAWKFIVWLHNRHRSAYDYLMSNKVTSLCARHGLPKYIAERWDEFVSEKDDDYGQHGSDDPEFDDPDDAYDPDPETIQTPAAKAATPVSEFDDEAKPQEPAKSFIYERQAFVSELRMKTDLLRRPSETFTITLDPEKDMRLGWVGRWLDAIPYGRQIVYERLGQSNKSILRVDIKWNVARYIVEHAEQFVKDGFVDEYFKPEIDPEVLAEIEAERATAEDHAHELERQRKEEAEAAELQRQKDAEAAEAERKRKNFEVNCRRVLMRNTDADREAFEWIGGSADEVIRVQTFLQTNFAKTVTITSASGAVLQAQVSGSLIAAWKSNEDGFLENGYVGTAADRESTAVAA